MTAAAALALLLAATAAVVDWWAVARDRRDVEYIAKPAVLVALIGSATALVPADATVRTVVLVGLTCGLIGDVLLMLDRFVPGAAAFLLGHVAYVAAFALVPRLPALLALGVVVLGILLAAVARPVLRGARQRSPVLAVVVALYLVALGAVLVLGIGTGVPAAAAGVTFFAVSDALLAYGRFVRPNPGGRVAVHVTYHVGQALLVLSLLTMS